jgi:4-hydroxy-4-methyl-2-oxoglutarate aldolase
VSVFKQDLVERVSKLYSAVLCDAMDHLGYRNQGMMHAIRPLYPEAHIVGSARTLLSVQKSGFPKEPYAQELAALDALERGDVIVFNTGGDFSAGVWGELLSTAAHAKGATGAVVDGLTRDAARICQKKFPVFARGISPYDSYGRSEVVAFDVPIECGGVRVSAGDVVFADYDGVVVIPPGILEAVLANAESKAFRERIVDDEFRKGSKVVEVFREHGIL